MKLIIIAILLIALCPTAFAQDWQDTPVTADAGEGMTWELQEQVSDDFNYEAPADNKGDQFFQKWKDSYHNHRKGPGLTVWDPAQVFVKDGKLQFFANRVPDTNKVYLGCITSKQRVVYPVYVEARAKLANSTLASDVWMLSPDDTQEIDIIEAYGASYSEGAGEDQTHFAERLHLSHHVFIREPLQDYQPRDEGSWYADNGTLWREDFHTVGVHWKDPWNLDYYVDGKLVRSVSGEDIIDPHGYTNGTGLNKPMDIIINMEDQDWRSDKGITPTDNELKNQEDHTFRVDWIRVYKPVEAKR